MARWCGRRPRPGRAARRARRARRRPGRPGRPSPGDRRDHGVGERLRRTRPGLGAERREQRRPRRTAYTTTATASASRDRARDRPRRVADLLAERGDPRVPGEREEQQPGRLEDAVARRAAARCRGPAAPPLGVPATTTTASDDQDAAATTITVARPAVRVIPAVDGGQRDDGGDGDRPLPRTGHERTRRRSAPSRRSTRSCRRRSPSRRGSPSHGPSRSRPYT